MVNNSINVQWTTKNNLEMECRNRKRQIRDEQLGKGKYSSQRQETNRCSAPDHYVQPGVKRICEAR